MNEFLGLTLQSETWQCYIQSNTQMSEQKKQLEWQVNMFCYLMRHDSSITGTRLRKGERGGGETHVIHFVLQVDPF